MKTTKWHEFKRYPEGNLPLMVAAGGVLAIEECPGYSRLLLRGGHTANAMGKAEDLLTEIEHQERRFATEAAEGS